MTEERLGIPPLSVPCPHCDQPAEVVLAATRRVVSMASTSCITRSPTMPDTIVTHRSCGTDIFVVRGGLNSGDVIDSRDWKSLGDWPDVQPGDETRCPSCGQGFILSDTDLERRDA